MTVVPLQCPHCHGAIQVETAHAGQQVACPHCQGLLTVPDFGPPPPEPAEEPSAFDFTRRRAFDFGALDSLGGSEPPTFGEPPPLPEPPSGHADELMPLSCPLCHGLFQTPLAAAGHQVACPHCSGLITVPPHSVSPPEAYSEGFQTVPEIAPPPADPGRFPPAHQPDLSAASQSHPIPLRPQSPADPRTSQQSLPTTPTEPPSAAARNDRLPPQSSRSAAESIKPASRPDRATRSSPGERTAKTPQRQQTAPSELPMSPSAGAQESSRSRPTPPPPSQAPEKEKKKRPAVDDLLPPGAPAPADANPRRTTVTSNEAPSNPILNPPQRPSRATVIDTLLPRGAGDILPSEVAPGTEVVIPDAPRKQPPLPTNVPAGAVVVPTPEGGYATIRKKAKTVGRGDEEVELKELTPQEKAKKRFRYNLVMWTVCVIILLIVFLVLAWPAVMK